MSWAASASRITEPQTDTALGLCNSDSLNSETKACAHPVQMEEEVLRRKSFLPADPTPCCCHREAGAELGCRNDSVGGHQAAVGSRSLGVPVARVTYTPDAWRGRIRNSLPPLSSCPQMKFWVPIICRGSRVRVPVYHIHLHEVATVFRELAMASGSHS